MTFFIDIVYLLLLFSMFPYLVSRMIVSGGFNLPLPLRQRFGSIPNRKTSHPCVWVHSVSVGEVLVARPLVERLRRAYPDWEIILSTITPTGYKVARKTFPNHFVFYFPFDLSFIVKRVLRQLRPSLVILMELEVWPNFLLHARMFSIPVAIANGRISESALKRYRLVRHPLRRILQGIDLFCAQNERYAARFLELGAPPQRVLIAGSMKFDSALPVETQASDEAYERLFGLRKEDWVFVAGSTHPAEHPILLEVVKQLRAKLPSARFILAPRHLNLIPDLEALLQQGGVRSVRRSRLDGEPASREDLAGKVILLDTIGELRSVYQVADVVFVGGSLVKHGGQNLLEPAVLGRAVLFGPSMENFQDSAELLLENQAAQQVENGEQLARWCLELAASPRRASEMGQRAADLIRRSVGASDRTLRALRPLIEKGQKCSL